MEHPFLAFQKISNFKNKKNDLLDTKRLIDSSKNDTTLDFTGTVKLHGTHGDIVRFNDRHINIQSRNRLLSIDSDNIEFAAFITQRENIINALFEKVILIYGNPQNHIMISGEFCGGNIQKYVILTKLPKMFVIFGIRIDNLDLDMELFRNIFDETVNIYNIYQFPTYNVTIDFENSSDAELLMTKYTNEIEKECPVGKYFGFSGIGEGIVWISKNGHCWFKTKGELLSHTKTTKIPIMINLSQEEKYKIIDQFVDNNVTENRLNQGIEYLHEFNIKISKENIHSFRKWIEDDITTEEISTIEKLDLKTEEYTLLKKRVSKFCIKWFLQYIKNNT
jgi:hypothetical protein